MPQDKDRFAAVIAQSVYTTAIANDWLRFLADVVPARVGEVPARVGDVPARVGDVPARKDILPDIAPLRDNAAQHFARPAALDTHRLHAQEEAYDTRLVAHSAGMVRLINACRKKDTCLTLNRDADGNLHARFDPQQRFDQSKIFGKPATDLIVNILRRKGHVLCT